MYYLKALQLKDKKVLLRLDLDLPENADGFDTTRLEVGAGTLNYILKKGAASVHVIGHRGRPDGKVVRKLSLKPFHDMLLKLVPEKLQDRVTFGENLRFDPGEEKNLVGFAKKLAKGFDIYVNDGFATAHREHASMVQLPKLLPTVMGRQFEKEIKVLRKIVYTPSRPVTLILGGAKEEKLEYIDRMFNLVNVFLVGGALAAGRKEELEKKNRKTIVADLNSDGLDITVESMEQFDRFIKASETVIWNGPVGKYEDEKHAAGTRYIANSLSKSKVYSVIGGGDTEAALSHLGFEHSLFSHVSTGGGAMMEYLVNGNLPAYKAIEDGQALFSWEKMLEFVI
jgi:3-phosphoglycerate kinase